MFHCSGAVRIPRHRWSWQPDQVSLSDGLRLSAAGMLTANPGGAGSRSVSGCRGPVVRRDRSTGGSRAFRASGLCRAAAPGRRVAHDPSGPASQRPHGPPAATQSLLIASVPRLPLPHATYTSCQQVPPVTTELTHNSRWIQRLSSEFPRLSRCKTRPFPCRLLTWHPTKRSRTTNGGQ